MARPQGEGPPWPGVNQNNSFKIHPYPHANIYDYGDAEGKQGESTTSAPPSEMGPAAAEAGQPPVLNPVTRASSEEHERELAKLTGLQPVGRQSSAGGSVDAAGGQQPPRRQLSHEEREAIRQRRRQEAAQKELADELKYTADHVVALVVPVSITMAAVVATIKSISYYSERGDNLAYTPYEGSCNEDAKGEAKTGEDCEDDSSDEDRLGGALLNVLIVMVILVFMTFGLVYCYKMKWYRLMDGFLAVSTFLIAGLIFYGYMVELLWATNTVMSWPTLIFIIHQFCWGGMYAIHYTAPLRVRQFYLVAVSVLMALVFVKYLPDWTTWILLGAVACYDLVAVLCPFGPLNMLIKEVQANPDRPFLPELVYSSTILFPVITMADRPAPSDANAQRQALNENMLPPEQPAPVAPGAARRQSSTEQQQRAQEEEEDTGVKLGLGDFIFYSVLVGSATTSNDWTVILACYVSIIVGLAATIFILAIFQRPLPALPISIFLALFFYFVSRVTLSPFLEDTMDHQIYI